jgi:hypothetical protein
VDMAGVNALRTITLPTGAAESVVRVTVINNDSQTYPLTIARDSGHTIFYNDTENTTVSFPYIEQWAEFSYTVTGTHWVVNDGSTPLSGTFSGALAVTGLLTANSGIILDDAAGQSTLNSYIASAEGDLGTVTAVGGSWDTTTNTTKKFKFTLLGNIVLFTWRIESTNAASGLTRLNFVLPATCPTPSLLSTVGSGEAIGFMGIVGAGNSTTSFPDPGNCTLYNNGGTYTVNVDIFVAAASKVVSGTIMYVTA